MIIIVIMIFVVSALYFYYHIEYYCKHLHPNLIYLCLLVTNSVYKWKHHQRAQLILSEFLPLCLLLFQDEGL